MDKVNWNVPTDVNTHPHTPAYKHEKDVRQSAMFASLQKRKQMINVYEVSPHFHYVFKKVHTVPISDILYLGHEVLTNSFPPI